ncbi:MAG: M48 family metalloprotease [Steroidobacteraceae bacterium]
MRSLMRSAFATGLLAGSLLLGSCARNPVTGAHDVTFVSEKGEIEEGRRAHEQVIRIYGVYEDQALQDYVNGVGQRLAKLSHRPELAFHFTVIDSDEINAFAIPGGYVYITRGIMAYLNSEAELAGVIGHEIGHVTARHSVKQQSQSVLTNILGMGAAIFTGSGAVADLANIGGEALLRGYGREMELQADGLGAEYIARAGYDPQAMIWVVGTLKNQESFERERAKAEGRDPNIYHGVFATHPDNDTRLQQAVLASGKAGAQLNGTQGVVDRDDYMKHIDGLPFGSSRQQGMVRDNRFYHADLGITMAFPRGWLVQNEREQLLSVSRSKDAVIRMTTDTLKDNETPQDYLRRALKGSSNSLDRGEIMNLAGGLQGYTGVVRSASTPFGNTPMRVGAIAMGKSVYVFLAASRSSTDGLPASDRVFVSVMETFRKMRTAEFPLAEPYRLKIQKANDDTRIAEVAKSVPITEYPVQQLRLINDLYPNKEPKSGSSFKTIE